METAVKVLRADGTEADCPMCSGPVSAGQQLVITTELRTVHLGCLAYANARDKGNRSIRRIDHVFPKR